MEAFVKGQSVVWHLKAQASFEQLIVIAIALAFISIAFFVAANYSADSAKLAQAEDAVQRLASGADRVYALGPNTKEYVTVYLPEDTVSINASGKRIMIKIGTSSGGTTDVYAYTKAELISALPPYRGKQKILIEYLASGQVSLGEAGLVCSPSLLTRVLDAGDTGSDTITVLNFAEYNVTGINATVSGFTSLVSISQPPATLPQGGNGSITIDYNIPSNLPTGVYGATVTVSSGNDGSCIAQVTMQVNGNSSCAALCASQGYSTGSCRANPASCVASGEDYKPGNDYACASNASIPSCCCYPTGDTWGPLVTYISSFPGNASAATQVTITAVCNDSTTGGSYISGADVQLDGGVFNPMNATDGQLNTSIVEWVNRTVGQLMPGQHIAGVRCSDTANNTGPIAYYYFNITASDAVGPIITMMNHSDPFPTTLANITEFFTATEVFTGNSNIQSCFLKLDNGNWYPAAALDGSYDSSTEDGSYNIGQLATGTHTVYVYCIDSVGNVGGIYNDTFGVSSADVVLILDRSGSMSETVTNAYDNTAKSTTSSLALVKSVVVNAKNGDLANVSARLRTSGSGCTTGFEARVGADIIASGNTTSTYYTTKKVETSIAAYSIPFTVDLYLRRIGTGCTAYNNNFAITQNPTKLLASKEAAKVFVDLTVNTTQLGLVSYATSSTTDRTLAGMGSAANKTTLKNSIDALVASGNTCIECGIDKARIELTSARSRYPDAVRVAVLLTDGQGNVGDSIQGATDARYANMTIYTIGFGDDVDVDELTNIALLTGGKFYYAPDAETLLCIYQHIGQITPC